MDLFEGNGALEKAHHEPLAARMRPDTVDGIVGQDHILGPGKLLRRAVEADLLGSIILYGPPGCGKTSLAEVIATTTRRRFERTSGVVANVETLRTLIKAAAHRKEHEGTETVLFIDEIHRFTKSQQDVLLPHVEKGTVTLIGATTHNPLFFINGPLNSRSQIFELAPLSEEAILVLLRRSLEDDKGLSPLHVTADEDALAHLARVSEGDARRALNALEIAALTTTPDAQGIVHITRGCAEDSIQKKAVLYDHDEDLHYDTISAFIKSVRGSDPDAALYWLAKMLYAGEDPRFIARRLVILASEDIGNADPRGLTIAVSAMQAVQFVGMPEARIILAQATTYLACAPKSNAAYLGIEAATTDVNTSRTLEVPEHLRNIHLADSATAAPDRKIPGKSADYTYPHDHKEHFFADQQYKPSSTVYYKPSNQGYEDTIARRLENWRAKRDAKGVTSNGKKGTTGPRDHGTPGPTEKKLIAEDREA
jgi:putative ATPase